MPSLRLTVKDLEGSRPKRRIRRHKVSQPSRRGSTTPQQPQEPPTSRHRGIVGVDAPRYNPDALPRHPTPGELYQPSCSIPLYSPQTPFASRSRHATPQVRSPPHDPPPPYSILNHEPPKDPERHRKKTSRTFTLRIQIGRGPRI
jgi:hypothetical protein